MFNSVCYSFFSLVFVFLTLSIRVYIYFGKQLFNGTITPVFAVGWSISITQCCYSLVAFSLWSVLIGLIKLLLKKSVGTPLETHASLIVLIWTISLNSLQNCLAIAAFIFFSFLPKNFNMLMTSTLKALTFKTQR